MLTPITTVMLTGEKPYGGPDVSVIIQTYTVVPFCGAPQGTAGAIFAETGIVRTMVMVRPTMTTSNTPRKIFAPGPGIGSPSLNKPIGRKINPNIIMSPETF